METLQKAVEAIPEAKVEPEPEPEPEPEAKAAPEADERLNAWVAEKEAEYAEKERALEAKAQEIAAEATKKAWEAFKADPKKFAKESGVEDYSNLAAQFWYEALGDDAPEAYRKKAQESALDARLKALEQSVEAARKDEQTRSQTAMLQAQAVMLDKELRDYTSNIPDELVYLNSLAQREGGVKAVYETLAEIAVDEVVAGRWPSLQKIAKELESALVEEVDSLVELKNRNGKSKTVKVTLNTQEQRKPPTRQETPEELESLSDDEWHKRGVRMLEAALRSQS